MVLFAIPNGGLRSAREAMRLRAEGVVAGVPDLFLAYASGPYHGLFIEMKRGKKGRVEEHQSDMHVVLETQGYCVLVCRTLEEFIQSVTWYFEQEPQ